MSVTQMSVTQLSVTVIILMILELFMLFYMITIFLTCSNHVSKVFAPPSHIIHEQPFTSLHQSILTKNFDRNQILVKIPWFSVPRDLVLLSIQ